MAKGHVGQRDCGDIGVGEVGFKDHGIRNAYSS